MQKNFADIKQIYQSNPELKQQDISDLKSWMKAQLHLPEISELQLLLFYHSCYYNIENVKKCIENYYTMRTKYPGLFQERNVFSEELQSELKVSIHTPLPTTTEEDYLIFYIRLMDTTPSNYIYNNQIKMMDMSLQLTLLQWGLKPGLVAIFDMEGTSFAHLFRINPITSKRLLDYVQEALPVRLKAVHLININRFTAQFIQLMKPFMKKYLGDLINVHKNLDSLYEVIPREALPNHLGGNAGTIEELHALEIKNLEDNADFFLEDDKLKMSDGN